jgi:drug/metabolite transporter (DMT)-like permease
MSRTAANLLLLLAAAFWGLGNVAQKTVLEHLDPLSAAGLRSLIGAALLAPLVILLEPRGHSVAGWWRSLARVAALFGGAMAVQQTAYLGTSVTNASFLVNTASVMTPLAAWLLVRERPSAAVALAAAMTLAGAFLLSGGMAGEVTRGDLAAILSAGLYAVWMVELGRHMQTFGRPLATAAAQFAGSALLLLPLGFVFGDLSLPGIRAAAPELAILGIFSTALAFGLQTVAQRFTSASHAAVIVSAESVFGAAGAAVLIGERISPIGAAGAVVVLAAIVYLALADAEKPVASGARRALS